MNIYVQDDLAEQVKQIDGLNVSSVCQDALRAELTRRAAIDKLTDKMERIEVYVDEPYSSDVAFIGREVAYAPDGAETTVYITRQGRIAAYDHYHQALHQYDTLDDFATDLEEGRPGLVADVARALGEKHVIELDI